MVILLKAEHAVRWVKSTIVVGYTRCILVSERCLCGFAGQIRHYIDHMFLLVVGTKSRGIVNQYTSYISLGTIYILPLGTS